MELEPFPFVTHSSLVSLLLSSNPPSDHPSYPPQPLYNPLLLILFHRYRPTLTRRPPYFLFRTTPNNKTKW